MCVDAISTEDAFKAVLVGFSSQAPKRTINIYIVTSYLSLLTVDYSQIIQCRGVCNVGAQCLVILFYGFL